MLNEIFKGMDNAAEQINENFQGLALESGSNDDGHYIKLPSGIQIVYNTGITMGAGQRNISITFPQSFSDANSIIILPVTSANGAQYAFEDEVRLNRGSVTTSGCSFFGKRNNQELAYLDYIAIGM